MSKELEALNTIKQAHYFIDFELDAKVSEDYKEELDIIESALKRLETYETPAKKEDIMNVSKRLMALEIIKSNDNFLLEFDESQNEWFLYISNGKHRVLVAKGTGIETYDLLKEILL